MTKLLRGANTCAYNYCQYKHNRCFQKISDLSLSHDMSYKPPSGYVHINILIDKHCKILFFFPNLFINILDLLLLLLLLLPKFQPNTTKNKNKNNKNKETDRLKLAL